MALDLTAISARHELFELALNSRYMEPYGPPAAAKASAEDVPKLLAEIGRLNAAIDKAKASATESLLSDNRLGRDDITDILDALDTDQT